ncbi:MAG: hypothetical protein H6737_26925 [Alphaproteobacteria bacterium]|nr:hypothetical protein [Alphaproteobacteria bacterium]
MLALALALLSGTAFAGDKDKDGVDNKTDACKDEPEDADGFEDEDGCPDPDNDADGFLDGSDKCPNEPEDKDGFEDDDGCPDPDNDGDGVNDADDECDGEIENDDVKDGCPEVTYGLMNEDGWSPALKSLNDGLANALDKGAESCPDAVSAAESWLKANDAAKLHKTFNDRLARAPEGFDGSIAIKVVEAQAAFWSSAKAAFDIYCKDDPKWPGFSTKLDGVYARAKNPEK